jgi:hypothetical protein
MTILYHTDTSQYGSRLHSFVYTTTCVLQLCLRRRRRGLTVIRDRLRHPTSTSCTWPLNYILNFVIRVRLRHPTSTSCTSSSFACGLYAVYQCGVRAYTRHLANIAASFHWCVSLLPPTFVCPFVDYCWALTRNKNGTRDLWWLYDAYVSASSSDLSVGSCKIHVRTTYIKACICIRMSFIVHTSYVVWWNHLSKVLVNKPIHALSSSSRFWCMHFFHILNRRFFWVFYTPMVDKHVYRNMDLHAVNYTHPAYFTMLEHIWHIVHARDEKSTHPTEMRNPLIPSARPSSVYWGQSGHTGGNFACNSNTDVHI